MTDWPYRFDADIPTPETAAAWTQLGLLPTERVPMWAAHWIVAGYDGESLVLLAGLHGDDPFDVRDALPGALRECGVAVPGSDIEAAALVFTHLARMHLDGRVAARWVSQEVEEVFIRSEYSDGVLDLPLGSVYGIDDEWGAGWGRCIEQLTADVRAACEEQLQSGPVAT
ncbi:MAG: hypothetical protein JWM19_6821 [Actinomycetia bacterium]|nr:hypothetical protein [Actinomycetes bacterium]